MKQWEMPEPPLEPPGEYCATADCGCELYDGGRVYEWGGKYLCPECYREAVSELSTDELAALLGSDITDVSKYR